MTTHESKDELDILYLRTFRRDELSLLDAQRVFFYRGALGAPITDTIYGRCQTCGRAVSVTPDGLIDD